MAAPTGERLARLESEQANQRGELRDFKKEVRDELAGIHTDVRAIRDALLQGKGGWRVAGALFGLGAAVLASIVTAAVLNWTGLRK